MSHSWHFKSERNGAECKNRISYCDDLRFQSKLRAEPAGNIRNTAWAVVNDIGDMADVVKHMATNEEKNEYKGYAGPEVARGKRGPDCVEGEFKCGEGDNSKAEIHGELGVVVGSVQFRCMVTIL